MRQVFYLPGFDPREPETYWGLFRRESRITSERRGIRIAVSEPVRSADGISLDWDVTGAIDGTTIPEGSKVLLFLAAANRDPRRWDDPERFDIDRSASGHVGFGFGIHQCLGQMVARLEAELVLGALLSRVRRIRLAGPPERRLNNTLHAIASLPVEVEPA